MLEAKSVTEMLIYCAVNAEVDVLLSCELLHGIFAAYSFLLS